MRDLDLWQHSHAFGQDQKRPGESRTLLVIVLTAAMMVVEISAGLVFGSMALLADGLHMASHAAALGISVFAYRYTRRHAHSAAYSFGTGKVNTLGGFSSAVLLSVFALLMAAESLDRLLHPVPIVFDQAILVAVFGLVINGASLFILGADHTHAEASGSAPHVHDHGPESARESGHNHSHDHNLRSAYLHVLADALTSVLAIFALLAAKYFGALWMDPVMGLFGALLVGRWSLGLIRTTSGVLLDRQGPERLRQRIRQALEEEADSRITDLHLWSIGPGIYAAVISLVARDPGTPEHYKARLPAGLGLEHVSIEIHRYPEEWPHSPA